MKALVPVEFEQRGLRLVSLTEDYAAGLTAAARHGRLWELWYTSVPAPEQVGDYIVTALAGQMLPWPVCDGRNSAIIGTTRYHDIVPAVPRLEIGYTWYGARWQRSQVNTVCKLLLIGHAFETLGCPVIGLRTDNFNLRSQRVIEALGEKRDGVLRHHALRSDGSVRDSVMYSILATEWPDVKRHLDLRLARHDASGA